LPLATASDSQQN